MPYWLFPPINISGVHGFLSFIVILLNNVEGIIQQY